MKEKIRLNIKGAVLDKEQLKSYLEKIASDHILTEKSDKNTYPIPRLKENFFVIKEIYKLLNEQIKQGISIHPAGEWILDNLYIIEEIAKNICKELTLKKYTEFIGLDNGRYKGFARIYVLASEMVAYTDGKINSENLAYMLQAYQYKKNLSMNEIWNIGIFIQIALIENIREICETIYVSQMQKYKVEDILSRFFEIHKKRDKASSLIEIKTDRSQQDDEQSNKKQLNEIQVRKISLNKMPSIKNNQTKNAFIEYMSYRLKKYGSKAYDYLNVLEEEVAKTGNDISEIIKKEHFDIAVKKVSIGNCIMTLKTMSRINFLEIFEKINQVEDILKQDPARQYELMDSDTKAYYRNAIQEIAKKTKISEIYIAKKCLELSKNEYNKIENIREGENTENINFKKAHIGYYLIAEGKERLLNNLLDKKVILKTKKEKAIQYIGTIWGISIVINLILCISFYYSIRTINSSNLLNIIATIALFIISLLPIENIVSKIIQYILSKVVKPKLIPKIDFQNGIPKEHSTMVVIPTILKNEDRVKELMRKLEVYYIANKSENIYFTLLGDCTSGSKEIEEYDESIIKRGIEITKRLNEKYGNIFNFVYRKRTWNENEECYMGWERKRGLLNQLNEYLLGNIKNPFRINTMENAKLQDIKYIITLDADTDLTLKSGLELIGAMAHVLNIPILNEQEDLVVSGHAILQPRVGIGLLESRNSVFTQIYAGEGGTDSYTNVISNLYQDNFDEGIFTGKGIYDLRVFSKVLNKEIKENTVLSHDLLEGSYLRCGLASDVLLMDGYPSNYMSFRTRLYRWIRGDYQILPWLKNRIEITNGEIKRNPLNLLSKYKIFSNIVRSKQEIAVFMLILFGILVNIFTKSTAWSFFTLGIISVIIPTILDFINSIISKKGGSKKTKRFIKTIDGLKASSLRGILDILLIPDKMYITLKAEIKTIYRMKKSKKHLLEWITSEEAEKIAKTDVISYYKNMWVNTTIGLFGIFLVLLNELVQIQTKSILVFILSLSVAWLCAPSIMCIISKKNKKEKPLEQISDNEKKYLLDIGYKTWLYFKDNITEKSHFLPPDNYQEDRKPKVVMRTSSTNIGLGLLAVMSSYDLGYEDFNSTIELLYKMINSIENLSKWNGHLYNWYNIETLEPLNPRYVSSVDSGNFIGYLYVLKQFLIEKENELKNYNISIENDRNQFIDKINFMINIIINIIDNTDFSKLYDEENRLFSIGFNVEDNKLTDSYYDLLASESRQTSLIAIAKRDVTEKHWYNLGRTLTTLNDYKGLISWSGTSFEYLMPTINIEQYPGSLLDESCRFMVMSQLEYAKKLGIPWGISEAAFNLKDLNNNYQYKAFGIPWLGIKRGLSDEIVTSTYGSILAINQEPKLVIENLKKLETEGMYDKYGFYESIDFTPGRTKNGYSPVKTYMAHHQGLILLSIDNLMKENIIQKRFKQNPEIEAVDILMQEKMPDNMITTKDEKERVEKIKYQDYEDYTQRKYSKINENLNISNVIANDRYTVVMDQYGNGYSNYNGIQINRYKETDEKDNGIKFYIKNIRNKNIWTNTYSKNLRKPDRYDIVFSPEADKIIRNDENIQTVTKTIVDTDEAVEIRRIELKNSGTTDEILEVTGYLEPILSNKMQDYAHKAFNNLFLSYEYLDSINTIVIKRKAHTNEEKDMYMAVSLYTQAHELGELEFEIDKEKFWGRCNYKLPKEVENSIPFSKKIGYTTDPIVALKKIVSIKPEETAFLDLIISVGEEKNLVVKNLVKFLNNENIKRTFELLKAKSEAENRYLGIKGKDIDVYQDMLGHLLFSPKVSIKKPVNNENFPVSELWKYGISGDLPILLVKIKDINDIDVIKEVLSAYDFFRVKNIKVDLVILNEEKESYENYVKDAIQSAIMSKNMEYLLNISGGIFCLDNIEKNDKKLLEIRAKLVINANYSSLALQMEDIKNKIIDNARETVLDTKQNRIIDQVENKEELINMSNLKYFNEYGGFSKDGREYCIKINEHNKLPTVWCHILANKNFGTLTTENMGGYTWYKNSRLNRITAWSNDQVADVPSEIIYLKDMDTSKKWSLGFNPMHDGNDYYIIYGFGYAKYLHNSSRIMQTVDMFVAKDDNVKINLITLENKNPQKKNLKLVYYIKPVLDEDEIKSNMFLKLEMNSSDNILFVKNVGCERKNNQIFISCSEKINSYTGSKASFFKGSTLENPIGIDQLELNREDSFGEDGIVAISINVSLEAFSTKKIAITLGDASNKLECQDIAYKYSNINNCRREYMNVKRYWEEVISTVQIKTPMESTNLLLNGWLAYQTISARLYGRTGFYQSGGAYGFRDQLQDVMLTKYMMPEMTREQILRNSKHQFVEGDVQHWWHEETNKGIRTRISDDLLWLPYVTADYISFTGDYNILEEETTYKVGEILKENENEKYDLYKDSEFKESLYDHCIKAIEKAMDFGEHGLPKIGTGDWNDGLSNVGAKGIGESVWLGFFMYAVLKEFIPICKYKNDLEHEKKYEQILNELKKDLNNNAWDSRWYKRAFTDKGETLGSLQNEECKIDSISQSWSVISGAGDNDKKYIAMESLENHLIDKEVGIIKLLDPPFEKSKLEPGYIKAYLPGTRENGGQYTHAAIWTIIAQAMLNLNDKAYENFRMINPIEHSRSKDSSNKYKVEPYVIAADVYGQGNLAGRGGWTWYTGSSSWMYIAGIKYILGLNIEKGYLKIQPHIPSNWKEYEIKYKYGNSLYNIKIMRAGEKTENEVSRNIIIKCNGEEINDGKIKLDRSGKIYNVEVIMEP